VTRSHPPALLTIAERAARDEGLFGRGDRVLCACSGGPDSTALLHALARLRERLGHEVVAHGVDHGLRPEAAAELDLARALAARLDVPFDVTRVDVSPGPNLQARARAARLAALAVAATRASARLVATGHTADDRAETFLLRLLRGAGPRGLAVLPPRAPFPAELAGGADLELVRPLLRARRRDVLAHLERHRVAFAEDPSNLNTRFTRARVRRELVPLLEDLSPRIVENLGSLADMLEARGEAPDPAEATLGRAQRLAVARARRLGRPSIELAIRGDPRVVLTLSGSEAVPGKKR
jgi:tRNA(Ile)-lysidine synthase